MKINEDLLKVFDEKIRPHILISEETSCWEWTRSLREGYGQFHPGSFSDKNLAVHRFSYETFCDELLKGEVVRHKCHNRKCCNPEHLLKGSHKDNWNDSKDVHWETHKNLARRSGWWINGIMYPTCRIMNKMTGLPMNTIVRNTDNDGVFDIDKYRETCKKQGVEPKV